VLSQQADVGEFAYFIVRPRALCSQHLEYSLILVVVLRYYFIIIEISIPNVHYTTHYEAVYFTARKLYVTAQSVTLAGYSAYLAFLAVIYA